MRLEAYVTLEKKSIANTKHDSLQHFTHFAVFCTIEALLKKDIWNKFLCNFGYNNPWKESKVLCVQIDKKAKVQK